MKVIVIGAGVMGLACAWRLAQGGAEVTIFEERECGKGATLASLGALWPASPSTHGRTQEMQRESLWQFEEFIRELGKASGVAIDFRRRGRIEFVQSGKAVERAREEAAAACREWPAFGGAGAAGRVMEVVAPGALAGIQAGLAETEWPAVVCRATAQVSVPQLISGLHTACEKAGVEIHAHVRVSGLEEENGRMAGVRIQGGSSQADVVLVAAGAWSGSLSSEVKSVAPIRPAKGQGIALRLPPGVHLKMIVKSGPIYLVPWDEEILVGSTTEPEAGFDELPTSDARALLSRGAAGIMPALAGAEILRHWAGLRPQNPAKGHLPLMGPHPAIAGLYVCTGHFKTGIGMAPLASRLMAEAILTGNAPTKLNPFLPRA